MFTLGHISDPHSTALRGAPVGAFLSKRFFGWISWNTRRKRVYRPEVLGAAVEDVIAQAPDHLAVTGDLTNVALEQEFVAAARWLHRLGDPSWVSVVPGNHDAYVHVPRHRSWDHWASFMSSDYGKGTVGEQNVGAADEFPTLRLRSEIALVGVCTAVPTPIFRASGTVGEGQLRRLEVLLRELGARGLCRVVMIHHPPVDDGTAPRRRLTDAAALRNVLARVGADLVLHGHRHQTSVTSVPGAHGSIPVVGVRSAAYLGTQEAKRAQYHIYRIEPSASRSRERSRYHIHMAIRGYDRRRKRFLPEGELEL